MHVLENKLKSNQQKDQLNLKILKIVFQSMLLLIILAIYSLFQKELYNSKTVSFQSRYNNKSNILQYRLEFLEFSRKRLQCTTVVPFSSISKKEIATIHARIYITILQSLRVNDPFTNLVSFCAVLSTDSTGTIHLFIGKAKNFPQHCKVSNHNQSCLLWIFTFTLYMTFTSSMNVYSPFSQQHIISSGHRHINEPIRSL